ncbi:hypothetical protein S40285_10931 [Stachybotrys chlorohalonatus IBT 40285]|uniref:Uncharacterized protein n=1 Tax=Stachybotrys chlorohalonatus (strain IBT 40285) TaxID=1283841 RepID=A0A084QYE1_STAC4|nr:hypothetical protein S40285_10931 [Stachybotrys chlorohalonata IBT 40285]
MRTGLPMSL